MANPYKVLTLGDSVMWGQGLLQQNKFVQLVAEHLQASGKQVALAALAHSGAVVCTDATPPGPFQYFLFGELPRSFPSISSQLAVAAQTSGYSPFLDPDGWDPDDWQAYKGFLQQQVAGYWPPDGSQPDLILIDGGINDLGAFQIVVPWQLDSPDPCAVGAPAAPVGGVARILGAVAAGGATLAAFNPNAIQLMTPDEFKQLVDKYVYDRMRLLIGRVAQKFPHSRVIVTGYFPIFTEGSLGAGALSPAAAMLFAPAANRQELVAALTWALHPALAGQQDLTNLIVAQSALWYSYSTQRLQEVVAEANLLYGQRFALASPSFGPNNGALAPDALLWSFTAPVDEILQKILDLLGAGTQTQQAVAGVPVAAPAAAFFGLGNAAAFATGLSVGAAIATDEASGRRALAAANYYVLSGTGRADPDTNLFNGFKTGCASVGHPNVQGAQVYFTAIEPFL